MNLSTAVVLVILLVCVFFSVRSLVKKGVCGSKEHCGGCGGSCSQGCASRISADKMAADVRERLSRMG